MTSTSEQPTALQSSSSSSFAFQKVNPREASSVNNNFNSTRDNNNKKNIFSSQQVPFHPPPPEDDIIGQINNVDDDGNDQQEQFLSPLEGSLCFVPQNQNSKSSALMTQKGPYYLPLQQIRIDLPLWNEEPLVEDDDSSNSNTNIKSSSSSIYINNHPNLVSSSSSSNHHSFPRRTSSSSSSSSMKSSSSTLNNVGNTTTTTTSRNNNILLKRLTELLEKPAKSYHWEGEALTFDDDFLNISSATLIGGNQGGGAINTSNSSSKNDSGASSLSKRKGMFSTTSVASLAKYLESFTDLHRKFMRRVRTNRETMAELKRKRCLRNKSQWMPKSKDSSVAVEDTDADEEKIFEEYQTRLVKNNFEDFEGFYVECIDHPIWRSFLIFFFAEEGFPMIMISANSQTFRDTLQRYCASVGVKVDFYGEACFLGGLSGPENVAQEEHLVRTTQQQEEANDNNKKQPQPQISTQSMLMMLQNLPFHFSQEQQNQQEALSNFHQHHQSLRTMHAQQKQQYISALKNQASSLAQSSSAALSGQHPGNVASMIMFDFLAQLHEIHPFQKIVADNNEEDNNNNNDDNTNGQQKQSPHQSQQAASSGNNNNVVEFSTSKPVAPNSLFNNDQFTNNNDDSSSSSLNSFEKEILNSATSSRSKMTDSSTTGGITSSAARGSSGNIVGSSTGIAPVHSFLSIVSGFPFHGGQMRQAPVRAQVVNTNNNSTEDSSSASTTTPSSTVTFTIGSSYHQHMTSSSSSSSGGSSFSDAVLLPHVLPYIIRNLFDQQQQNLTNSSSLLTEKGAASLSLLDSYHSNKSLHQNQNANNNISDNRLVNHILISFLPYLGRGAVALKKMIQLQQKTIANDSAANKPGKFGAFLGTSSKSNSDQNSNKMFGLSMAESFGSTLYSLSKPGSISLSFPKKITSAPTTTSTINNKKQQKPAEHGFFFDNAKGQNYHQAFSKGKLLVNKKQDLNAASTVFSPSSMTTTTVALDTLANAFRKKKIAKGTCLWTSLSRLSCDTFLARNDQTSGVLSADEMCDSEFLMRTIELRRFAHCHHHRDEKYQQQQESSSSIGTATDRRRQREENDDDGKSASSSSAARDDFRMCLIVDVIKNEF